MPWRHGRSVLGLAAVAFVGVAVACSSASAPLNGFAGKWQGAAGGTTYVITASQFDTSVTGTGTATSASGSLALTISGVSSASTLLLTLTATDGTADYTGTYVTSDSVVGFIETAPSVASVALSFKRQ